MMRWLKSRSLRLWLPFAAAALLVLLIPIPGSARPTLRHITVDAKQFEFSPSRIHVNQGDRVIITVTASDVVHGFYLDGYGLKARIEPGISQRIEFVAERAGKFRYRCAVSCGPLHPFMIGELVVGANSPFWRAIGLVLVAVTGMLVYLWQVGNNSSSQEMVYGQ